MKLRYWYKIDHNKQPIPGSNIRRKSRPGATHQWKEILDPCCSPNDIDCTCGPRYFIQLDGQGKPVDGTLIKRVFQSKNNLPEGTDGNKLYEIQWKSVCCAFINWSLQVTDTTGSLLITVNGDEIVNTAITGSTGSFKANVGDIIEVTLTNTGNSPLFNSLLITGGTTFLSTDTPIITTTFTWNVMDTNIAASITGS